MNARTKCTRAPPDAASSCLPPQPQPAAFVVNSLGMLELYLAAPPGLLIARHHSAPPSPDRRLNPIRCCYAIATHMRRKSDVVIVTCLCSVSSTCELEAP
jgi:hypothetical protein